MRFAFWIIKATQTQNMKYFLLSHGNNGFADVPHCYVSTYSFFFACHLFLHNFLNISHSMDPLPAMQKIKRDIALRVRYSDVLYFLRILFSSCLLRFPTFWIKTS
jgi:hypothetical protein